MQDLTEKARMDYLMQYKEKKQGGTVSIPRKSVLKSSVTTARLPPAKPEPPPKPDPAKRSLANGINATSSPKLGGLQVPAKSATVKVAVISRKK